MTPDLDGRLELQAMIDGLTDTSLDEGPTPSSLALQEYVLILEVLDDNWSFFYCHGFRWANFRPGMV